MKSWSQPSNPNAPPLDSPPPPNPVHRRSPRLVRGGEPKLEHLHFLDMSRATKHMSRKENQTFGASLEAVKAGCVASRKGQDINLRIAPGMRDPENPVHNERVQWIDGPYKHGSPGCRFEPPHLTTTYLYGDPATTVVAVWNPVIEDLLAGDWMFWEEAKNSEPVTG